MDFFTHYKELFIIFSTVSILTFILSLLVIPLIIIKLSPDYFQKRNSPLIKYKNPITRYLVLILKNILGYILFLMGIIMLFIPGQGLLSITIGIFLMNFPGKKHLEYKFFSNKNVSRVINAIRRKAGKPELHYFD